MRQSITSPHNARLRAAAGLQSSRNRKRENSIIIFGIREAERALAAGLPLNELFVSPDLADINRVAALEALTFESNPACKMYDLSAELFRKIAYGDRLDGIAAVSTRPRTDLATLKPSHDGFILVMESIEKPGNVGAVIRSADGAGAGAVILANPATDFFHPNSIRSSVGTVFSVPIAMDDSVSVAAWLSKKNYRIVLAAGEADQSFFDIDLSGRIAIVLGNEARGLSESWKSLANATAARLPMHGLADSLNISAAASAIMYLAASRRC